MREIVFRGKKLNGGEWIEGSLIKFSEDKYEIHVPFDPNKEIAIENTLEKVATETIGQYTGFRDTNGVRIFEGDIVNFVIFDFNGRDIHYTGVVKFDQGFYQIWKTVESECWGSDGAFVIGWIGEDEIEVVGNVFENAELLEVE